MLQNKAFEWLRTKRVANTTTRTERNLRKTCFDKIPSDPRGLSLPAQDRHSPRPARQDRVFPKVTPRPNVAILDDSTGLHTASRITLDGIPILKSALSDVNLRLQNMCPFFLVTRCIKNGPALLDGVG